MSNIKANFIGKSPLLFPSQIPSYSKLRHLDILEAVQVAPKNPAMQSIAMYELAPRTINESCSLIPKKAKTQLTKFPNASHGCVLCQSLPERTVKMFWCLQENAIFETAPPPKKKKQIPPKKQTTKPLEKTPNFSVHRTEFLANGTIL